MNWRLVAIGLLLSSIAFAQEIQVVDRQTHEPLVFVNLVSKQSQQLLGTTDFDGRFNIQASHLRETILLRHIGYKTVELNMPLNQQQLKVKMVRTSTALPTFDVYGQIDKGPDLMQKVIDRHKKSSPVYNKDFECVIYTKMNLSLALSDTNPSVEDQQRLDSALKGGDMMLLESVVKYTSLKSGHTQENIIASKISGFKDPSIAVLASDFQPFGFYSNFVKLFDEKYLNPLTSRGFSKYTYTCLDTLLAGEDSIFIVAFRPKAFGAERLLEGAVHVHSKSYSVRNLVAKPQIDGLMGFEIEQVYESGADGFVFPQELNVKLAFKEYPSGSITLNGYTRSYVDSVQWIENRRKESLPINVISSIDPSSNDALMATYRKTPLNQRDSITYRRMDSLFQKMPMKLVSTFSEAMVDQKVSFGIFDLDLNSLITINEFEKYRLGLGLYTNHRFSKHFELGGFAGYGIGDSRWKYGGEFKLNLMKYEQLSITFNYANTVKEIGFHNAAPTTQFFDLRSFYSSMFDYNEGFQIKIRSNLIDDLNASLGLINEHLTPGYRYSFLKNAKTFKSYHHFGLNLTLDYQYKRKTFYVNNHLSALSSTFPRIRLSYTRGLKNQFGSFDYHKFDLDVTSSFHLIGTKATDVTIGAGYIDQSIPLGLTYTGQGALVSFPYVFMDGYFQTAKPYEFVTDQHITFIVRQELLQLFKHGKFISPKIVGSEKVHFGSLQQPENHRDFLFTVPSNGLYEVGLELKELFKYNYMGMCYLNLGLGTFYRHGYYANSDPWVNTSLRLMATFSFD